MERGTSGSRRENMGKNVTRSRDEAQVREHLFCKQPAPNAVFYSTGRPKNPSVIGCHPPTSDSATPPLEPMPGGPPGGLSGPVISPA